ncbi:hypothetical protein HHK36_028240 [Tetracentron sinense]|uniref:Uncharacterized protein n=1 Tax=Tetracentron sinense TaxID=13715 RepID=A0A834YI48_TETSI|nr:hypothetical protein HHK36_028240 [Tetracentron sinense]
MSFEGFDDWDEIFLDQAIRIEEDLIAMSAPNPTHHHHSILILDDPPSPSPLPVDYQSFSPPREFSQKDPQRPSNGFANITIGNSSPLVRRVGKGKEIEIDRLKVRVFTLLRSFDATLIFERTSNVYGVFVRLTSIPVSGGRRRWVSFPGGKGKVQGSGKIESSTRGHIAIDNNSHMAGQATNPFRRSEVRRGYASREAEEAGAEFQNRQNIALPVYGFDCRGTLGGRARSKRSIRKVRLTEPHWRWQKVQRQARKQHELRVEGEDGLKENIISKGAVRIELDVAIGEAEPRASPNLSASLRGLEKRPMLGQGSCDLIFTGGKGEADPRPVHIKNHFGALGSLDSDSWAGDAGPDNTKSGDPFSQDSKLGAFDKSLQLVSVSEGAEELPSSKGMTEAFRSILLRAIELASSSFASITILGDPKDSLQALQAYDSPLCSHKVLSSEFGESPLRLGCGSALRSSDGSFSGYSMGGVPEFVEDSQALLVRGNSSNDSHLVRRLVDYPSDLETSGRYSQERPKEPVEVLNNSQKHSSSPVMAGHSRELYQPIQVSQFALKNLEITYSEVDSSGGCGGDKGSADKGKSPTSYLYIPSSNMRESDSQENRPSVSNEGEPGKIMARSAGDQELVSRAESGQGGKVHKVGTLIPELGLSSKPTVDTAQIQSKGLVLLPQMNQEDVSNWVLNQMEGVSKVLGLSLNEHESEGRKLFQRIEGGEEQDCVELKKDRNKKEEQLKSVFSQIEAKDAEIHHLKSINVSMDCWKLGIEGIQNEASRRDVMTTRMVTAPERSAISFTFQHGGRGGSRGSFRGRGGYGGDSRRPEGFGDPTAHTATSTANSGFTIAPTSLLVPRDDMESLCHDFDEMFIINICCKTTYEIGYTGREYGALILDHPGISPQCQNANTSIDQAGPRTDHALMTFKSIGVQTDTSDECTDFTIKNDISSRHDLSNKLLGIWCCPGGQRSGRNLVSKLFITCATDFHVLFSCMSMSISSKITPDTLADESFSDAALHNDMQSVHSIETVKVSRLYSMLTKISNEMLQLDVLFEALLDLCVLENVVIVHRSLRIVRVILQQLLTLERRYDKRFVLHLFGDLCTLLRDNVMVKGICSKNNILEFHVPERKQTGVQFGLSRDETSFSGCISSSMKSNDVEFLFNKGHKNSSKLTSVGCLDWVSVFEMMHQIIMTNTEEGIRVEAMSIMNLILMRSNPYMEREKYGLTVVFETVSQLLRKEAGLCVQKQAVHLLFLLLNCPKLLIMCCSDYKDNEESTGAKDASAFRGFSILLEGLAECVACSGNGTEELKLRRHAIIVLAFVASSGKSGFEMLLNQGLSKRTNFLELIVRVLASEMDAEAAELAEPPEICIERTFLLREALILLNRLASNPIYSTAALGALTSSREMASLVIDVANRMSRKGKSYWKSDSTKKMQMREFEIVELARIFRTRVFTYLGNSIS